MSLKLITGRANSGKTGLVLADAFAALARGEDATIVVPQLVDARRLEQELSGKSPIGVRVVTSRSLAEETWQLYGDGRRFVGQATRSALVRQAIGELTGSRFLASVQGPGFDRLVTEAAQRCRPEAGAVDPELPGPATMVLGVIERYREMLTERGLVEFEWVARLLAPGTPALAASIGFIRFDSFKQAEVDLIGVLAQGNDVAVALTWEEAFAPTEGNNQLASDFAEVAYLHVIAGAPKAEGEIGSLGDRLFDGPGSLVATGEVSLGVAAGMEAEAELVARFAGEIVAAGTPPERIVLVFGNLSERANALENALAAKGLLAEFDYGRRLTKTPFGRSLVALLRLSLGIGNRSDALQLLGGPFSDADRDVAHRLDTGWRRNRQEGDSRLLMRSIISLGGRLGGCAELALALSSRALDPVSAVKWQEMADALLCGADSSGERSVRAIDARSHRAFIRAIGEMASVSGAPFGAVDVLSAMEGLSCSSDAAELEGRIQVTEVSRLGARRYDAVIVGGLSAREFPVEGPDSFAQELEDRDGLAKGHRQDGLARLRFYSLVTRARAKLHLIRQSANSDGAPLRQSVMWEQVLDAYRTPGSAIGDYPPGGPLQLHITSSELHALAPVFTAGRRELRNPRTGSVPVLRCQRRGRVSEEQSALLLSDKRAFSATEVEAYLRCPYQWFYGRVLSPRDVDARLDAEERGSRSHRLIAAFYLAMKHAGVSRVTRLDLEDALLLFDRVSDETERGLMQPQGLAEELDAARARSWARQVVIDDADLLPGFAPAGHEVVFGEKETFEFAGVPMKGRIDRVDRGERGMVITDYKSSRDVPGFTKFEKGGHIQAIVYAVAAQQAYGDAVVASVYRSLRSRRLRGFWRGDLLAMPAGACEDDALGEAGFEALLAGAEAVVASAVEGMKAGRIPRQASIAGACTYCGIASLCEGAKL